MFNINDCTSYIKCILPCTIVQLLYILCSSCRFYVLLIIVRNFEIGACFTFCCSTSTYQEIRKEFESIEQQWARKVEERDKEIENLKSRTRYLNSMAPEEKGVSAWKEIEVVQWINYNLPVSHWGLGSRSDVHFYQN